MGGVIDTNLLLYAANSDTNEHAAARKFIGTTLQAGDHWYLTEGVLYEFLRVATHPRVFPSPLEGAEALSFLEPLVESPSYSILTAGDRHWASLTEIVRGLRRPSGNLFFDIRTAALMREHGIARVYTADTDFDRFKGLRVVNPLTDA